MRHSNVPDHETFWENDPDMLQKSKNYQEWALSLVNDVSNPFLPPHARHPWQNDVFNLDDKICIFEREDQDDHNRACFSLNEAKDILMHSDTTPKDKRAHKKTRRVILLQDMNPRAIELLGVTLNIPPHFFLAHCDHMASLSVVDNVYSKLNDSTYWRVQIPRKLDTRLLNVPFGLYWVEWGSLVRGYVTFQSYMPLNCSNIVSCWAKASDPDSWTAFQAVILTDSNKSCIRPVVTQQVSFPNIPNGSEFQVKGSPAPFHRVLNTDTRSDVDTLTQCSIFDAAVAAYRVNKIPHTDDPFEATIFVRNIIRSNWESFAAVLASDVSGAYMSDWLEYPPRLVTADGGLMTSPKNARIIAQYNNLVLFQQNIMAYKEMMSPILWEFRCKDVFILSHNLSTSPESARQEHRLLQDALKTERKSWALLHERLDNMQATLTAQLEMSAQRAALEQAAASLQQAEAATRSARTSGQLTKIATIIVPCTFVASIFSMNGRFAAGGDLFYIYWTISIPVTLGLLSWVLYGDIINNMYTNIIKPRKDLGPWA